MGPHSVDWPPLQRRPMLVAVILTFCAAIGGCHRDQDERQVMEVVLAQFSQRTNTHVADDEIVLVRERTYELTPSTVGSTDKLNRQCPVPEELYYATAASNRQPQSVAGALSKSPRWRVATRDEEKEGFFLAGKMIDGRRVKTLVQLTFPGISKDGQQALMVFAFTNSIHVPTLKSQWQVGDFLFGFHFPGLGWRCPICQRRVLLRVVGIWRSNFGHSTGDIVC